MYFPHIGIESEGPLTDDEIEAAWQERAAALARTVGCEDADEPCKPPFSLVGLVLILCTGVPLLGVIVWALVSWLPAV